MSERADAPDGIEMPRPTAAPLILATGIVLFFGGIAMSYAMSLVGAFLIVVGLANWVGTFAPGRGHFHEARTGWVPRPVVPAPGSVAHLQEGMPGYRMRLPLEVQPISA